MSYVRQGIGNPCPRPECGKPRVTAYCAEHDREYKREYVRRPEVKARAAAQARERYAANPQKVIERSRRWEAANVERRDIAQHARGRLNFAVKSGRLTRPSTCEQCGSGGRIEGAHHDYSRPLDVRWLCRSCHRQWDRAEPKTLAPAS